MSCVDPSWLRCLYHHLQRFGLSSQGAEGNSMGTSELLAQNQHTSGGARAACRITDPDGL